MRDQVSVCEQQQNCLTRRGVKRKRTSEPEGRNLFQRLKGIAMTIIGSIFNEESPWTSMFDWTRGRRVFGQYSRLDETEQRPPNRGMCDIDSILTKRFLIIRDSFTYWHY